MRDEPAPPDHAPRDARDAAYAIELGKTAPAGPIFAPTLAPTLAAAGERPDPRGLDVRALLAVLGLALAASALGRLPRVGSAAERA